MFDMDWSPDEKTETMLWHMAIQNAIEYSGKAAPGSVIGRLMSVRQDLRPHGKVLSPIIANKVTQANNLGTYLPKRLQNYWKNEKNKSNGKVYLH